MKNEDRDLLKETFLRLVEQNPFMQMGEVIYLLLQREILEMRLLPGTRLNITQLAQQLGVSRTPVYSTMERLCAEGLLENPSCRKTYLVSPMNRSDLLELCLARASIEGGAAYLAAQRAAPAELDVLQLLCRRYTACATLPDTSGQAEIDSAFHLHLVQLSQNSYYIRSYGLLQHQLVRYRNYINTLPDKEAVRAAIQASQSNHWAIYNALKLHLATVARAEAERDVQNMNNILRSL